MVAADPEDNTNFDNRLEVLRIKQSMDKVQQRIDSLTGTKESLANRGFKSDAIDEKLNSANAELSGLQVKLSETYEALKQEKAEQDMKPLCQRIKKRS